ncbi:VanZ family protein [Eubacteriales bacterium mix99]|nr:VanZ family protein [Clostridiales bacterium]
MKQTDRKNTRYVWTLPVLWMCIIFAFSHQPGNDSSRMSGGITQIIESMAGFLNINTDRFDLHLFVRKSAHFLEFAVLGALFFAAFRPASRRPSPRSGLRTGLRAQAAGMAYAATDELHQLFVPGRSCQVRDMLIDSCGVLLAVLLCCAFYLARGRRRAEYH